MTSPLAPPNKDLPMYRFEDEDDDALGGLWSYTLSTEPVRYDDPQFIESTRRIFGQLFLATRAEWEALGVVEETEQQENQR